MTLTPVTYDVVHVVVPAHNEQDLLEDCLSSLARAVRHLRANHPLVRARLTVVADRCTDQTELLAWELGADLVAADAGSVGRARRIGVERVEALAAGTSERVWVANTDADSVVPPHWLSRQLELAESGYGLVLGTVCPDPHGIELSLLRDWHLAHDLTEGHPHVHGANLGVSLEALRATGGFAPVPVGEDVLLAEAVRRAGLPCCATATMQVTTSSRLVSRVDEGFAAVLRGLQETRLSS